MYEAWHGLERDSLPMWQMRSEDPFTIPATPERSAYIAGHSFFVVAPVLAGNWSFLGETDKIIKAR